MNRSVYPLGYLQIQAILMRPSLCYQVLCLLLVQDLALVSELNTWRNESLLPFQGMYCI